MLGPTFTNNIFWGGSCFQNSGVTMFSTWFYVHGFKGTGWKLYVFSAAFSSSKLFFFPFFFALNQAFWSEKALGIRAAFARKASRQLLKKEHVQALQVGQGQVGKG